MLYSPYPYQDHAEQHIIDNPGAGLFMEMGLGKTVVAMTATDKLMNDLLEVNKTLIIAPKKVAETTWTTEKNKWDHLKHLRISRVLGTEKQRREALRVKADIYIINRENVCWLISQYDAKFPFDMVIIDESSSFKDPDTKRFKALRRIRPFVKRVLLLTGTPAPNSLLELWPQLYLLDQGKRLGETLIGFREKFFVKEAHKAYASYEIRKEYGDELIGEDYYERKIYNKIGDICISMKAKDYLDLPERIDRNVYVDFSPEVMKRYNDFERDQVLALKDTQITAVNAAALRVKLMQFANGAMYDEDKVWHEIHDEKLEALEEELEAAGDEPVFIAYWFKHDLERILKRIKNQNPVVLKTEKDIIAWNQGKIKRFLAHPASAGHGLNLQDGGHIVEWFGPIYSLELYLQFVTRLDRQGQRYRVLNNRIIARNTIDEDILDVLDRKGDMQDALMQAVKALIKKYS